MWSIPGKHGPVRRFGFFGTALAHLFHQKTRGGKSRQKRFRSSWFNRRLHFAGVCIKRERNAMSCARVLLVDDDREMLDFLRRLFAEHQINTRTVDTGERALRALLDHQVDVAICDIQLPGMNGVEPLKAIKKHRPLCQVVMLTGYSRLQYVVETLESGAVDYFLKPIDGGEELVETVRAALDRAGRWRAGFRTQGSPFWSVDHG